MFRIKDCLRHLVQVRLVRATATLSHEQEVVVELVTDLRVRVEFDLRRQVAARVLLFVHGDRSVL